MTLSFSRAWKQLKRRAMMFTPVFMLPKRAQKRMNKVEEILFHHQQKNRTINHATASYNRIRHFGRPFLLGLKAFRVAGTPFRLRILPSHAESPIGLHWMTARKGVSGTKLVFTHGELKLGFTANMVIIEAIQGVNKNRENVATLNTALKESWANAAIRVVEETARRTGYRYVAIRRAAKIPAVTRFEEGHSATTDEEASKIKDRITGMYATIARKMNYTKHGDFYRKEIV